MVRESLLYHLVVGSQAAVVVEDAYGEDVVAVETEAFSADIDELPGSDEGTQDEDHGEGELDDDEGFTECASAQAGDTSQAARWIEGGQIECGIGAGEEADKNGDADQSCQDARLREVECDGMADEVSPGGQGEMSQSDGERQ